MERKEEEKTIPIEIVAATKKQKTQLATIKQREKTNEK